MKTAPCWCLLLCLCLPGWVKAGVVAAFPGAEGGGALSLGGRGGKVLVVDRLDDPCEGDCSTQALRDPSRLVPGTLRWALLQPYPRTVVFRIAGVVELLPMQVQKTAKGYDYTRDTTLRITSPYLTVAGQTAPEPGITLRHAGISVETHDVVLRYIRLRTGRDTSLAVPNQQNPETLMIASGARDVMVDHCSVSWMPAEGVSVYANGNRHGKSRALRNVTVSWNLIGEGLIQDDKGLGHPSGAFMAGFEGGVAPEHISLHHNLLVHSQKRNADFLVKSGHLVNNIVYNWQWLGTVVAGGAHLDVIGNRWKPGPQTARDPLSRRPLHLVPAAADRAVYRHEADDWWEAVTGKPLLYLHGNGYQAGDMQAKGRQQDWDLVCHYTSRHESCLEGSRTQAWRSDKPVAASPVAITVTPPDQLETVLQAGVGASQRLGANGEWLASRDAVDQRYLNEYAAGTYRNERFPWHEDEVGGFPVSSSSRSAPYDDADRDGMADAWEKCQGLNPSEAADAVRDRNKDGYTNLEAFLNGILP